MNILITYYSRTHVTEKVALKLKEELNSDLEEINDKKSRSSFFAYIKSGFQAVRKIPADIEETKKNPNEYDLVIIGTPVWAGTMATPILTYLKQNKDNFNDVAFFCTCGGSEGKTFVNMEELLSKKPLSTLSMNKKDIESSFDSMVTEFAEDIKNNN